MRVLVIEDDDKIGAFVAEGLREAGHAAELVTDGEEGLGRGITGDHDVAIVDLMLPGLDGLSIIERWREQAIDTPVLILSAKRSVDDRVRGLRAGGDDYVTKPFSLSEVLARVEALGRRGARGAEPTSREFADLKLDLLSRQVSRAGKPIELQPREFKLLELLMRTPGRILSRTSILEQVYGYDFDPQTNVVEVLVSRLRAKVDRDFEPKLIHTVRGVGYVLRS